MPTHKTDQPVATPPEPVLLKMPVDISSVALTTIATIAAVFAIRELRDVLLPMILSLLLFYALDPAVDKLTRFLGRAFATTLVLTTSVAAFSFAAWTLRDDATRVIAELPDAARQVRQLLRQNGSGPGSFDHLKKAADELERAAAEGVASKGIPGIQKVEITESPLRVTDLLWGGTLGTASIVAQGIVILFLTFFLLLTDDLYKRKLVKLAGPTLAKKRVTVQVLQAISRQIERFLLVQLLTSAIVGVLTGVALWLLGLSQPALWGVVAGVLNIVPYFGPIFVTGALATVGLIQFGTPWQAGLVAGVALLITTLEGYLLTPLLISHASQINKVVVFVCVLFWTWIWGVWGALLAIPIMMVVKAVCDHVEDLQPVSELLSE